MAYIKTNGTSSQFLKSNGSVSETEYVLGSKTRSSYITYKSLSINGTYCSFYLYAILIGGYCIGVTVTVNMPLACFSNNNTYQKSTSALTTDSRFLPTFGSAILLSEGRQTGSTSEGKNVKLRKDGYVYVCGINAHQFGSSTSNPTYSSSTYVKLGCSYMVEPFKYT